MFTRPFFRRVTAVIAFAAPLHLMGCGGDDNNDSDIVNLPIASPFPPVTFSPSPSPTPTANPSPGTSPIPLPTPAPTPSVAPTPPPTSGETLVQGEGVLVFTDTGADTNVPTDPLFTGSGGATAGAKLVSVGANGNSLQVFLSDIRGGQSRSFSIVVADRTTVKEGAVFTLNGVTDRVIDPVAFVLLSAKPASDAGDTALKQWHSASGGTVHVERVSGGVARVRIENARMVPYTAARQNGQNGTFTVSGAAFVAIEP
ncbi:MAG: hypothetical protein H7Y38_17030 [Armatimonadetes bacterium]|nr:hypothetical protein [Armatimonadota bacterium]